MNSYCLSSYFVCILQHLLRNQVSLWAQASRQYTVKPWLARLAWCSWWIRHRLGGSEHVQSNAYSAKNQLELCMELMKAVKS